MAKKKQSDKRMSDPSGFIVRGPDGKEILRTDEKGEKKKRGKRGKK